MTSLFLEYYLDQKSRWPDEGRHILAQFDDDTIVVYQAYRPSIGHFAAKHGYLGGEFKLTRMSWIKPNFLWMMYRCGWAQKTDQEVVLAIRIQRTAFDQILSEAVHSSYVEPVYGSRDIWKSRVAASNVRLQFDPDHDPKGLPVDRRAIQLGLRGPILGKFACEWIVEVEDMSEFVRSQHELVQKDQLDELQTPAEHVFPVENPDVRKRLGLAEST